MKKNLIIIALVFTLAALLALALPVLASTDSPNQPMLHVVKTVDTGGAAEVPLGGVVTYTVVISNSGDSLASGVMLTDTLPGAIESVVWRTQGSATLLMPQNVIKWGPYDVPTDTQYTLVYVATLGTGTAKAGEMVENTATLNASNASSVSDSASFTIVMPSPMIYLPYVSRSN